MRELIRKRVKDAFHRYSRGGKVGSSRKYGISYEAIVAHLGPCPGERGAFHIDHIIPLAMFDFDNPKEVKAAFAPENHQWLPADENLSKNARCDVEILLAYLAAHNIIRKP